jgi:hypothetical protein
MWAGQNIIYITEIRDEALSCVCYLLKDVLNHVWMITPS